MIEANETEWVRALEQALKDGRHPANEARLKVLFHKISAATHACQSYHGFIEQEMKSVIDSFLRGDPLETIVCVLVQSGFCLALETERALMFGGASETSKVVVN